MSTEEQTSLADDIGEIYDDLATEVEETEAENVVEDAAEEEVVEETEEETVEAEEDAEEIEEQPESDDENEEAEEEDEAAPEEEDEGTEPLAHWKMKDKEYFKTLPKEAKSFLVERDKEFQRQASEKITEVMHIKRAIDPIREEMQQFGVSDDQAVRTLVGAHLMLKNDPKQGIKHLMGQYQLTPEMLFSADDPQDSADPRVVALENKVNTYEQDVIAREQAMLAGRIEEFKKNAEFFDDVQKEMIIVAHSERAMNPGVTPDIEVLYEKACRMNDDVWAKIEAKRRKASGKTKAADRSLNAAGAKVKTTAASKKTSAKSGPTSMREDLESSWDEVEQRQHGTAL